MRSYVISIITVSKETCWRNIYIIYFTVYVKVYSCNWCLILFTLILLTICSWFSESRWFFFTAVHYRSSSFIEVTEVRNGWTQCRISWIRISMNRMTHWSALPSTSFITTYRSSRLRNFISLLGVIRAASLLRTATL